MLAARGFCVGNSLNVLGDGVFWDVMTGQAGLYGIKGETE